ncbi:MMPL family transporter [Streptomyces sp. NPDC051677]|uniref:MMPL family transporter n=1 Tax=Streptomyces sp. NPDC051677 TaxID=3365669 RepID=UPI0037D6B198
MGTAGSAVVFAGLTVVVALSDLSVIGIHSLISRGLAFAVTVAVVIALTLLPAMLGFAGMRIMKYKLLTRRMKALERGEGQALGVRWAQFVTRNPVKVHAVSEAGLTLLALPATSLRLAPCPTTPGVHQAAPSASPTTPSAKASDRASAAH